MAAGSFSAWYIPGQPEGFWILRGQTGLWAFPNTAGAWTRGLRFRVTREPESEPIPPTLARKVAHLLGVPGFNPLDDDSEALALWEMAEERLALQDRPAVVVVGDSLRTHRAHVETVADVLRIAGLEGVKA